MTRGVSVLGFRSTAMSVRYLLPIRGDGKKKKKKNKNKQNQQQQKSKLSKLSKAAQEQQNKVKKAFVDPPLDNKWLEADRKRDHIRDPKEEQKRILLVKEWSRYKMDQHRSALIKLRDIYKCRDKALRELKVLSPTLYAKALLVEPKLLPYNCKGPTFTPPLTEYDQPEAEVAAK